MPVFKSSSPFTFSVLAASLCGCFSPVDEVNATAAAPQGSSSGEAATSGMTSSDATDGSTTASVGSSSRGGSSSDGTAVGDSSTGVVDADGDGFPVSDDCNDEDPYVFPGAPEICNLRDDDCDDVVDQGRSVPTHFETIVEALSEAEAGDVICVGPGIWYETLDLSAGVMLQSAEGSANTTLSAPADTSVVRVVESDEVTVRGFTITGGVSNRGAGIEVTDSVGVVLEDLVVVGNQQVQRGATCTGSGILVRDGSSVIGRRVRVFDNTSTCRFTAGAVRTNTLSTLILENSSIIGNVQNASESANSPLTVSNGTLELRNVVIAGNDTHAQVNTYGAAVQLQGLGNYVFENVTVANNVAQSEAYARPGALLFTGNSSTTLTSVLTNLSLTGNVVTAPQSPVQSGGIGFDGDNVDLSFDHCNLWGNVPADVPSSLEHPAGVDGNVSVDPMHIDVTSADPTKWDLRLLEGSALIDAGTPYLDDPDESVSDIGAFGGPAADRWR